MQFPLVNFKNLFKAIQLLIIYNSLNEAKVCISNSCLLKINQKRVLLGSFEVKHRRRTLCTSRIFTSKLTTQDEVFH